MWSPEHMSLSFRSLLASARQTTMEPVFVDPRLDAQLKVDFKKGNAAITKLYAEEESLKEIAEAFQMLDVSGSGLKGIGDAKISRDEFKKGIAKLGLHQPEGSAPGWKDDAFDRFDADGSGHVDYNEMCFMLGRQVLEAKAQGITKSAKECMQEVIGGLQENSLSDVADSFN